MRLVLKTPSGEVNPLEHLPVVLGAQEALGATHHGIFVRVTEGKSRRSFVSSRHAELSEISGTLVLRDLGSVNGTFLNGERIEETKLKAGDVFTLSRHKACRFEVLVDPRLTAPPPPTFLGPGQTVPGDERSAAMKTWLTGLRSAGFRRFLQATQPLSEDERRTLRDAFAWAQDPDTRRLLAELVGLGRRPLVQRHLGQVARNLDLDEHAVSGFLSLP